MYFVDETGFCEWKNSLDDAVEYYNKSPWHCEDPLCNIAKVMGDALGCFDDGEWEHKALFTRVDIDGMSFREVWDKYSCGERD